MEVRFEPGHHLGSAETSHETYSIDLLDIVYDVRTYYSVSYIHIILSSYNHLISVYIAYSAPLGRMPFLRHIQASRGRQRSGGDRAEHAQARHH